MNRASSVHILSRCVLVVAVAVAAIVAVVAVVVVAVVLIVVVGYACIAYSLKLSLSHIQSTCF